MHNDELHRRCIENLKKLSQEDPEQALIRLRGMKSTDMLSVARSDSEVLLKNIEGRCANLLLGNLGDLNPEQARSVEEVLGYVQKMRAALTLMVDLALLAQE